MKGKKKLIIIIPILIVAGVMAYRNLQQKAHIDPNVIRISGNIEVTDAEVSFKIPGRVAERAVSEGETVKAGQLIALLDTSELEQEVAVRRAELQAAEAVLAELEAGSRPEEIAQAAAMVRRTQADLDSLVAGARPQEIAAADADVERARAEADFLKAEYERQKNLYEKGIVARRDFEAAQKTYEVANANLQRIGQQQSLVVEGPRRQDIARARAAVSETQQRYELIKNGPRKEAIEQARARVEQVRSTMALTETRLQYARLLSPLNGIVLSENVEPGEYVVPGTPVVTVGDLQNVWLRGYINETDLGRVKVGQRVCITTDTYSDRVYAGHISFIASQAEFTPKNVQTDKERVKLVYRVKVEIPNPDFELKPGMPADAEIFLNGGDEKCRP